MSLIALFVDSPLLFNVQGFIWHEVRGDNKGTYGSVMTYIRDLLFYPAYFNISIMMRLAFIN